MRAAESETNEANVYFEFLEMLQNAGVDCIEAVMIRKLSQAVNWVIFPK